MGGDKCKITLAKGRALRDQYHAVRIDGRHPQAETPIGYSSVCGFACKKRLWAAAPPSSGGQNSSGLHQSISEYVL